MTANPQPKRPFTAEIQLRKVGHHREGGHQTKDPGTREILSAIEALREEVRQLRAAQEPKTAEAEAEAQAQADAEALAAQAEARSKLEEVAMLRTGLRAMNNSIQQTKAEIAALRHPRATDDRIVAVTNELDAIVNATEGATNYILEAAEKIDHIAHNIRTNSQEPYVQQLADDVMESVVHIFESCNFQDITGQRITKVVNTLKFIEDRVTRMIDIWGADEFGDLPLEEEAAPKDEDKKLLNGPQLEGKAISQAEIDKLFD